MIKIGINGYGRIGRVIHRICDRNRNISVVSINDINPDIHNIAYLANYDSTYGPRDERIRVAGKKLQYEENEISVYHEAKISDVSWDNEGIDILIDSSGIQSNLKDALSLKDTIKHVIVTNSSIEVKVLWKVAVLKTVMGKASMTTLIQTLFTLYILELTFLQESE